MGETYSKPYRPIGEASYGHIVFREVIVPVAKLVLSVPYTDNDLTVNFHGAARQKFAVQPRHVGAITTHQVEVEIHEFMPNPGDPNDGDPAHGEWVLNTALGTGVADPNEMFVHNQEDTMRLTRVVLTPIGTLIDTDVKVIIEGRRDT